MRVARRLLREIAMPYERTATLIWNPRAGRGGSRLVYEVESFRCYLEERGVAVASLRTEAPSDATRFAREAIERGVTEIIVSGGDGTINEALQGITGVAGVRLGILARGTANVLARELKLPFKGKDAAQVILAGRTRALHIGCATTEATGARRHFFLMAGIGLDASIVRRVPPNLKQHTGELAFWYSGLAHLARWQPVSFTIETNDENITATFAAIGKAPRYGGGLSVTPGAQMTEPQFQLCVVDSRSRLRYLRLLTHALRGNVAEGQQGARLLHATRARVTGDALVQLDGELFGSLPMTFEIAPQPVTIFVPE
jgi:YegS/Rv2252/BmrU family lipid kinase